MKIKLYSNEQTSSPISPTTHLDQQVRVTSENLSTHPPFPFPIMPSGAADEGTSASQGFREVPIDETDRNEIPGYLKVRTLTA